MQLGVIGLGRMGGNIVRRLARKGHECVVFDENPTAIEALVGRVVTGGGDLEHLVSQLRKPCAVWVMLPAGEITEKTVQQLAAFLAPGDTIVDGGNAFYKDDIRRAKSLKSK
ncbi:MAG: NAD(P)-binding domain-containing protein, partial [Hyphomicrobiaceae bacterium]